MKQHYTQGRELAAKGRHGDSMLLHVSPKEVHGLASLGALTGRRVTINPATGLPEAFDFSSLLPAIAAIAVSFIPGVGPVAAPLAAAAVSGGVTAAKGGSMGDVAQSALISGATTYAGGQLAEGIGGLGTLGGSGAAPGALPTVAGTEAFNQAATAAATESATKLTAAQAGLKAADAFVGPPTSQAAAQYAVNAKIVGDAAAAAKAAAAAPTPTFAGAADAFGTKVGNIGRAFTGNTGETLKYMAANPFQTAGTALGLSGMGQYQAPADDTGDEKRTYPVRKGFGTQSPPQTTSFPGAGYNPDAGDYNYFPGAGQPSTPPATPTAGNYFASGGGSVPSGLRAMPDRRMASGGALDSSAGMFRRPFGEAFNMPTGAYTPTYLTPAPAPPAPEASEAPVGGGGVGLRPDSNPAAGNLDGPGVGLLPGSNPAAGNLDGGDSGGENGGGAPAPAAPNSDGGDSGGGEAAGGLITLRKASGGALDSSADMFRRPFGEAFNMPTEAYTPTYLTPAPEAPEAPAPEAPVGRDFVLAVPASGGDGGGEGGQGEGGQGGGGQGGGGQGGGVGDVGPGGNTDGDPGGVGGHGDGPDSAAAGGLITLRKAAGGRAAGRPDHYGMTAGLMAEAQAALLGQHDDPRRALARFEAMFGAGALQMLRDKIGGGRIRGAGGGLDDLVPGTIEGKQRVRLADGEFVVPADVVSGIGDGSTDQGVRKLHEMMTSVRAERTGKRTQPKRLREGALIV